MNQRRQNLALVPDLLQHSVEIVAQPYQFWERHRFIPGGSQCCDHLWKPHSVGISRWQFIRAPLEAWNHIRELDCNPGITREKRRRIGEFSAKIDRHMATFGDLTLSVSPDAHFVFGHADNIAAREDTSRHSVRIATIGATDAARRAGPRLARIATRIAIAAATG